MYLNHAGTTRQYFFVQRMLPATGNSPTDCTTYWPLSLAPSGCTAFDGYRCQAYASPGGVPVVPIIIGVCAGFVALIILIVCARACCRCCSSDKDDKAPK